MITLFYSFPNVHDLKTGDLLFFPKYCSHFYIITKVDLNNDCIFVWDLTLHVSSRIANIDINRDITSEYVHLRS